MYTTEKQGLRTKKAKSKSIEAKCNLAKGRLINWVLQE
ncbi:hypothetical protein CLV59_105358 [Chitinophaga dinghuensis]|uniref:Uncharacterized protein n=1 Tax=Chitinophaga dinghuensis TaxID=1539050 RepID=A0A327VYI0_9BACT|nr:hypothetical protein CLV59_105358 [Chitinophaga dinghuensis]